jgi:hypothetical protein
LLILLPEQNLLPLKNRRLNRHGLVCQWTRSARSIRWADDE